MKNNQKEIDMIVKELRKFNIYCMREDNLIHIEAFKRFANSILSKLQKDEIVLARGRVIDLIRDKKLKDLLAWQYLYKTIELITRVVKDE